MNVSCSPFDTPFDSPFDSLIEGTGFTFFPLTHSVVVRMPFPVLSKSSLQLGLLFITFSVVVPFHAILLTREECKTVEETMLS